MALNKKKYITQTILLGIAFILQIIPVFLNNAYFYLPNGTKATVNFAGLQRWTYQGVDFEVKTSNCLDFGCFVILLNPQLTGVILAFIGLMVVVSTIRYFFLRGLILQFINYIFVGTVGFLIVAFTLTCVITFLKFSANQMKGAYTFEIAPLVLVLVSAIPLLVGMVLEEAQRREIKTLDIKGELMNKLNI